MISVRTNNPHTKENLAAVCDYTSKLMGTKLSQGQVLDILIQEQKQKLEQNYYQSAFFGSHNERGWVMTEDGIKEFVKGIDRSEAYDDTSGIYLHGIEVALITLGFDPDFVFETLWKELYRTYLEPAMRNSSPPVEDLLRMANERREKLEKENREKK